MSNYTEASTVQIYKIDDVSVDLPSLSVFMYTTENNIYSIDNQNFETVLRLIQRSMSKKAKISTFRFREKLTVEIRWTCTTSICNKPTNFTEFCI